MEVFLMEIRKELEQFILNELAIDQDITSLTPDDDLLSQGIIDSLGILKLSTFIEEKFGVKVSDMDLVPENFQNLESLTEFVKQRK
jgi:acyl carrier protein